MKSVFSIVVFLHGLIHSLGFIKAFDIKDIKGLTLPIPGIFGVVWLIAFILFLIYGILYLFNYRFAWLVGIIAMFISQTLVFIFWKDARFGTIPNLLILSVCIIFFGFYNFEKTVQSEFDDLINKTVITENRILSEKDIDRLPEPVKKWLIRSGAVGKPYIKIARLIQQAEMKMKPEQKEWMVASAVQYTTMDNPAFIWWVNIVENGLHCGSFWQNLFLTFSSRLLKLTTHLLPIKTLYS